MSETETLKNICNFYSSDPAIDPESKFNSPTKGDNVGEKMGQDKNLDEKVKESPNFHKHHSQFIDEIKDLGGESKESLLQLHNVRKHQTFGINTFQTGHGLNFGKTQEILEEERKKLNMTQFNKVVKNA